MEEIVQEKSVEEKKFIKGYSLVDFPLTFEKVIVFGNEQINTYELIVKMANALRENGLMK